MHITKNWICLLLILVCIFSVPAWGQSPTDPSVSTDGQSPTDQSVPIEAQSPTDPLTIAVASDLHLDPDIKESHYGGTVNPFEIYNTEITDALLHDVILQNVDVLLLTGDLTNAGGEKAHRTLIRKLQAAKKEGLQTYILPGNHDLTAEEADWFSDMYSEFGYSDAYSRDTDSLSYSLLLNSGLNNGLNNGQNNSQNNRLTNGTSENQNLMLLMLDTDGYTRRTRGAYLSATTLQWIEDQLKQAKEKNLQLLVAGHYSLLTGQTTEFTGKDELIALLKKYQVPLYLCGHLHQRNVASENGVTELVVDQAISYPCSYALLYKEGQDTYRYSPRKIDVNAWAKETNQKSQDLLNFDEYMESAFLERCEETVRLLKGKQYLSKRKTQKAIEFFTQVQQEYFLGTLPEHRKDIYKEAGYKAFMKIADGTTYGRWIPMFIEKASPYTVGFVLKDGQIK